MRWTPHLYPGQTTLHLTVLYWAITGSWHWLSASVSGFLHMVLWAWIASFPFYQCKNLSPKMLNNMWELNSYLGAGFEVSQGEWSLGSFLCLLWWVILWPSLLSQMLFLSKDLDAMSSNILTVVPGKADISSLSSLLELPKPLTLLNKWSLSLQNVPGCSQSTVKSNS